MAVLAESLTVLRRPRFLTVVVGEGLSFIGDTAFEVALAWAVLEATGSVAALAGVLLFQAVPRSLLLLFGGALVDRYSPRRVLILSHVISGVAVGLVGIVSAVGEVELWQLYALAVVMGISASMSVPAGETIITTLVERGQLDRANAVQGTLEQLSYVVGPTLGGLVVAGAGVHVAFLVDAASFLLATATVLAAPRSTPVAVERGARVVLRQIREGLQHARRSPETRIVLLIVSAATLSYSGVFAVGLPSLARYLDGGAAALGLMVTGWGVGQLVGAVAATITGLPRRWGVLIIVMTLVEAAMFATLGLVPSAWAAALLLGVVGVGVSYSSDVALPTFVQSRTPAHLLGRVTSLINLPRALFEPVSIAVLAAALSRSVPWGFSIAALPVLLTGVALLLNPRARRLESAPSAPEVADPAA